MSTLLKLLPVLALVAGAPALAADAKGSPPGGAKAPTAQGCPNGQMMSGAQKGGHMMSGQAMNGHMAGGQRGGQSGSMMNRQGGRMMNGANGQCPPGSQTPKSDAPASSSPPAK